MTAEEEKKYRKMLIPVAIYAFLLYINFDDITGPIDIVNAYVNEYASKKDLLLGLAFFSIFTASLMIITQIFLYAIERVSKIIKFEKNSYYPAAIFVNFFVLLYEFHILEFRLKLIGLTIALIIFFIIGYAIAYRILDLIRPVLKLIDLIDDVDSVNEILNTDDDSEKK